MKSTQSDINNFIGKFLNEDETMGDAKGYHKGLFTAMNPDQVANHFYEQGKADALKESIAKSKNVNMDPRQAHVENVNTSGFTARVLNNDDTPDFKFRIKICRKEAKESTYWLKLIFEGNKDNEIDKSKNKQLINESIELKKILSAILLKTE